MDRTFSVVLIFWSNYIWPRWTKTKAGAKKILPWKKLGREGPKVEAKNRCFLLILCLVVYHFESLQQVLSTLLLDAKNRARPSCNCNVDWELSFEFTSTSIRQAQKAFRRTIFVKHTRKKLFYIVHFFFTKFRRNALFQKIMAKRKENFRENLQRGWYLRLYQLTSLPNPNLFQFWQPS